MGCDPANTGAENPEGTTEPEPRLRQPSTTRQCLQLFWSFFKTGLFTLGGGYAMLPMLRAEIVHKYKWLNDEEMLNIYAISQTIPGTIAVNTATYTGYRQRKFIGGAAAALGMVTPSIIIITLIAAFLGSFTDNPWVAKAFMGIRAGVAGILLIMVIDLCRKIAHDIFSVAVAVIALALVSLNVVSVIWIIPLGGLAGVIYYSALTKEKIAATPEGSASPAVNGSQKNVEPENGDVNREGKG